ncbi:MAG: LCP family protein [Ruminococcus sp.]|nr:LCP family protein [Ruminococcus sp.]
MARFQDDGFVDISSSAEVKKLYKNDPNYQDPKKTKKKTKGKALRITALVLSIIFLIGGTVLLVGYRYLDLFKHKDIEKLDVGIVDHTKDNSDGKNISYSGGKDSLLNDEHVLNILLFGQDYRQDETDYGRSDSMILMSIDTINKKIKLTSFQRDTYVTIPEHGNDKINAAFSLGGEALSIATIEANFGPQVDYFATVDFSSFREIINILGGIDIELNLEEIQYINAQIDVNDQLDRTSFLKYDPNKETQVMHLDGYQALWYARDRGEENLGGNPEYSFSGDDWDRTQRQRKLIQTVINQLKGNVSVGDLVEIVNKVGPLVTTNLKKSDIAFLVTNMLTFMNYELVEMTLPTQGNWSYGRTDDGQSVIVIDDWTQVRKDLAEFIYESNVAK